MHRHVHGCRPCDCTGVNVRIAAALVTTLCAAASPTSWSQRSQNAQGTRNLGVAGPSLSSQWQAVVELGTIAQAASRPVPLLNDAQQTFVTAGIMLSPYRGGQMQSSSPADEYPTVATIAVRGDGTQILAGCNGDGFLHVYTQPPLPAAPASFSCTVKVAKCYPMDVVGVYDELSGVAFITGRDVFGVVAIGVTNIGSIYSVWQTPTGPATYSSIAYSNATAVVVAVGVNGALALRARDGSPLQSPQQTADEVMVIEQPSATEAMVVMASGSLLSTFALSGSGVQSLMWALPLATGCAIQFTCTSLAAQPNTSLIFAATSTPTGQGVVWAVRYDGTFAWSMVAGDATPSEFNCTSPSLASAPPTTQLATDAFHVLYVASGSTTRIIDTQLNTSAPFFGNVPAQTSYFAITDSAFVFMHCDDTCLVQSSTKFSLPPFDPTLAWTTPSGNVWGGGAALAGGPPPGAGCAWLACLGPQRPGVGPLPVCGYPAMDGDMGLYVSGPIAILVDTQGVIHAPCSMWTKDGVQVMTTASCPTLTCAFCNNMLLGVDAHGIQRILACNNGAITVVAMGSPWGVLTSVATPFATDDICSLLQGAVSSVYDVSDDTLYISASASYGVLAVTGYFNVTTVALSIKWQIPNGGYSAIALSNALHMLIGVSASATFAHDAATGALLSSQSVGGPCVMVLDAYFGSISLVVTCGPASLAAMTLSPAGVLSAPLWTTTFAPSTVTALAGAYPYAYVGLEDGNNGFSVAAVNLAQHGNVMWRTSVSSAMSTVISQIIVDGQQRLYVSADLVYAIDAQSGQVLGPIGTNSSTPVGMALSYPGQLQIALSTQYGSVGYLCFANASAVGPPPSPSASPSTTATATSSPSHSLTSTASGSSSASVTSSSSTLPAPANQPAAPSGTSIALVAGLSVGMLIAGVAIGAIAALVLMRRCAPRAAYMEPHYESLPAHDTGINPTGMHVVPSHVVD